MSELRPVTSSQIKARRLLGQVRLKTCISGYSSHTSVAGKMFQVVKV